MMPSETLSVPELLTLLAKALWGLDKDEELASRLEAALPNGADETKAAAAREQLLQVAAMPEARTQLAAELRCSYEELTRWVILCDLRQLPGLTWAQAEALQAA